MYEKKKIASGIWCLFVILPFILLKISAKIEMGFYSGLFALAFFFFFIEDISSSTALQMFVAVGLCSLLVYVPCWFMFPDCFNAV